MSKKERALERQYREGYRRKPESASIGKLGAKLAAEVWPKEDWTDFFVSQPANLRLKRRRD